VVTPGALRGHLSGDCDHRTVIVLRELPVAIQQGLWSFQLGFAMDVSYRLEADLSVEAFVDVLRRSTLAERRPVDQPDTIRGMLQRADVIVTARFDGALVGVSRAISDFHFCTYLSDLAVDMAFQRCGIGRELIRRTHEAAGLHTGLILLAAPKAESYYPRIGMRRHNSCWFIPPAAPHPGSGRSSAARERPGRCAERSTIPPR